MLGCLLLVRGSMTSKQSNQKCASVTYSTGVR